MQKQIFQKLDSEIKQPYKMVVGNIVPQNVYLYKTSIDIDTEVIEQDIEILNEETGAPAINPKYQSLITSTIYIEGGGGGEVSRQYKLSLTKITPSAAINLYGGEGVIKIPILK